MPKYWMVSNRNVQADGLGDRRADLSYWVADGSSVHKFDRWKRVAKGADFQKMLAAAADAFPVLDEAENLDQKHVTLFVHGYNNSWQEAAKRYEKLSKALFDGPNGLGICVLFTWPSNGKVYGYLPDREDARATAPQLSEVLNALYDWMQAKQRAATADAAKACKAKTSVIAHSMGNFVLQNAMQYTWTRNNQPLLVSLVNQLLMVAADVDNDLFGSGEVVAKTDGDAIANLTYRVTALYSGRDSVLGASAGLKHFGKRRLGRSGLDRTGALPDNVWDVDCSRWFAPATSDIHSAYFETPGVIDLMREVLRGVDRTVLGNTGVLSPV